MYPALDDQMLPITHAFPPLSPVGRLTSDTRFGPELDAESPHGIIENDFNDQRYENRHGSVR